MNTTSSRTSKTFDPWSFRKSTAHSRTTEPSFNTIIVTLSTVSHKTSKEWSNSYSKLVSIQEFFPTGWLSRVFMLPFSSNISETHFFLFPCIHMSRSTASQDTKRQTKYIHTYTHTHITKKYKHTHRKDYYPLHKDKHETQWTALQSVR